MKTSIATYGQHFFLRPDERPLYTVRHFPEAADANHHGVILCKPTRGERIRTHRIFFNLARLLASRGCSVITCDYFGDGNSGGETTDLNFDGMVEDITTLGEHLRQQHPRLKRISMVGLRIGANCALAAESALRPVDKILMFEPLPKPIDVLKTALRANLASQMTIHKKVLRNRQALIEDIENDIPVNVDGFLVGKKLWQSYEKATPLTAPEGFGAETQIYSMAANGRLASNFQSLCERIPGATYHQIEKEFIWTDWKHYVHKPPVFFRTVENFLCDSAKEQA